MDENEIVAPVAIVVEQDADERSLVTALLDESEFITIECQSGEAALATLRMHGSDVALLLADQRLAGHMDGAHLAREVKLRRPDLTMVLLSEQTDQDMRSLPEDILILSKPWLPLDVLMIANRAKSVESHMLPQRGW
jgi:two-component system, cell cycle response regulator CpdR